MGKAKGTKKAPIGKAILKKAIVDFRYKPTLRVYQAMDQVGIALSGEFPDWERAPLALALRNRKKHRQLIVQFRQSVFECIDPGEEEEELKVVKESVETVSKKLQVSKFQRFAIRCMYVADARTDYDSLVDLIYRKFCSPIEHLKPFAEYQLKDSAYAVNLSRQDWTYNVRVGPMTRDEWFSTIAHEQKAFETDSGGETFEKYRRTLPDRFVFFDIDVWREDVLHEEARQKMRPLRERASTIAGGLAEFLRS